MSVPAEPTGQDAIEGDNAGQEAPQGASPLWGLLTGIGVILIALVVSVLGMFGPDGNVTPPTTVAVVAAVESATSVAPSPLPPTSTAIPPTAVPSATSVAAAASTFEPVATSTPEPEAAILAWRDDFVFSDAVLVSAPTLPPAEPGIAFAAWLAGPTTSLFLGTLPDDGSGPPSLIYRSPTHENLLALYDRAFVTRVPADAANIEVVNAVLAGAVPAEALVHIRHMLAGISTTPNGAGFAVGLRQESDEVLRHAGFLKAATDADDLRLTRLHAEHLVNMIEGAQGEHFGDADGDGRVKNPGDGFGILPNGTQPGYTTGMTDHARLAAAASDATDVVRLHAGHVEVAGDNVRGWAGEIRDRALRVLSASNVAEIQADVAEIATVAQLLVRGVDINLDEQIEPVPGEGGVATAYQHAQLMAGTALHTDIGAIAAAPQPGPPATAQPLQITISDLVFQPSKITVPVGAVVIWNNPSGEAHTVTADDPSFDRPRLEVGETFDHTFTEPGTYAYFCGIHGGRGGEGMAGTIIVAGPNP